MSKRIIQNIFLAYNEQLQRSPQPLKNRKAIHALMHCRTREMGTSFYQCDGRHEVTEQHHSCRHRSCYLCAQKQRIEWIEKQKQRLLDTPHFHVIFTLPHEYLPLWRYNEKLFASILFEASQKTLLELIGDKKYWGLTPGTLMTLHTWGRQLTLHPHTHCLVTAGGVTPGGDWQAMDKFLLPGGVVRRLYRGKIQAALRDAFDRAELVLPPDWSERGFRSLHRSLYRKDWSVRIEERYDHAKGVALYLARYCKGGPLNPPQIQAVDERAVHMSYLDHRDKRTKVQRLKPLQFIQRLLQHVPTPGLHTVRYYGLYASAAKRRYGACLARLGCIADRPEHYGSDLRTVLLYCKTCGDPAKLRYRSWPHRAKGISINKEAPPHARVGGQYNNEIKTYTAKDSFDDSS
jgi:hypothetical protein